MLRLLQSAQRHARRAVAPACSVWARREPVLLGGDLYGKCQHFLGKLASEGQTIAETDIRLNPGQARYLNYTRPFGGSRLAGPPELERVQIRAAWSLAGPPEIGLSECLGRQFVATLEIFGRDGATVVLYPGPLAGPPEKSTAGPPE